MRKGILLLCLWTPSVLAGVYKWVDGEGNVQFSDKPPPGGAQPIEIKDNRIESGGLRKSEHKMLGEMKAAEKRKEKARERALRKTRQQNRDQQTGDPYLCESARERVEEYEAELRRGCSVADCEYYKQRRTDHIGQARRYCR